MKNQNRRSFSTNNPEHNISIENASGDSDHADPEKKVPIPSPASKSVIDKEKELWFRVPNHY